MGSVFLIKLEKEDTLSLDQIRTDELECDCGEVIDEVKWDEESFCFKAICDCGKVYNLKPTEFTIEQESKKKEGAGP